MSKWDKMDREVWSKSEVIQEFEKKIVHSMLTIQDKIIKEADVKDVPGDLKQINQEAPQAADNLTRVGDAVEKMYSADDEEVSDKSPEEKAEQVEEIAEDLVDCLQRLADALIDDGDTALAYKIERVIRDIEDGFIRDDEE